MQVCKQVALADCIVLNKVDLAEDSQITSLRERVACISPDTPVFACAQSCVPPGNVVSLRAYDMNVICERLLWQPAGKVRW